MSDTKDSKGAPVKLTAAQLRSATMHGGETDCVDCAAAVTRAALIDKANEIGNLSRRTNAPVLSVDSTLDEICTWLQWCDPNGCHTAELAAINDMDPYTDESVWGALADMVSE